MQRPKGEIASSLAMTEQRTRVAISLFCLIAGRERRDRFVPRDDSAVIASATWQSLFFGLPAQKSEIASSLAMTTRCHFERSVAISLIGLPAQKGEIASSLAMTTRCHCERSAAISPESCLSTLWVLRPLILSLRAQRGNLSYLFDRRTEKARSLRPSR